MIASLFVVALGSWLILAPEILGYAGTYSGDFSALAGSIIAALATVAAWDVMRSLRWLCAIGALAVLFSPGWMVSPDPSATVVNIITGLLILSLSLLGRRGRKVYGGGWMSLVKRDTDQWTKITWS